MKATIVASGMGGCLVSSQGYALFRFNEVVNDSRVHFMELVQRRPARLVAVVIHQDNRVGKFSFSNLIKQPPKQIGQEEWTFEGTHTN